jgi:hypothetical protein
MAYDLDDLSDAPWSTFVAVAVDILLARPDALALALKRPVINAFVVTSVLDAAAQRGLPIPAGWDAYTAVLERDRPPDDARVERILLALPAARRDALLARFELPAEIEPRPRAGRRILGPHSKGWRYLGLATNRAAAAQRAVEAIATWREPSRGEVLPDIARCVHALAPEIRAVLAAGATMTPVGEAALQRALEGRS